MMEPQSSCEQKRDIRLVATIWIWVLSIFLLLACVPILALTDNSFLLPLAVPIAVAIGTASIWYFGTPKFLEKDKKFQALQSRIANLEEIAEVLDFEKKINRS